MKLNLFGNITKYSIQRRRVIYFVLMFIIALGIINYKSLPKSVNPEVKQPFVSITTVMIGASSEDVDELITDKIVESLKGISDIKKINATSTQGYSSVMIELLERADVLSKIQEIQKSVNSIKGELPEDCQDSIVQEYNMLDFPTIGIQLSTDIPYKESKEVVDNLEIQLKGIKGVSDVAISGMKTPVIHIVPNRKRMEQYGITEDALIGSIQGKNFSIPMGELEIKNNKYAIKSDNRLNSIKDIKDIEIAKQGTRSIYLNNIAKVIYTEEATKSKAFKVKNGIKKPIINMYIYKDQDADIVAVNKEVKKIVENYKKQIDKDVTIDINFDMSKYIVDTLQEVINNAIGGAMSVIIILFLFINLREAIIAAFVIPVTVITSIALFEVVGLTINMYSLLGLLIALGMIVDNAIVVIEMIDEKQKTIKEKIPFSELVTFSTNNVAPAIFSSTLTTICGYIPLLFMAGWIGKVMKPMPLATVIAIGISFLASITITPLLAYQLLDTHKKKEKNAKTIVVYLIIVSIISAFAFSDSWKLGLPSIIGAVVFPILVGIKFYQEKKSIRFKGYDKAISKIMNHKKLQIGAIGLTFILLISAIGLLLSGLIKIDVADSGDIERLTGKVELPIGSVYEESYEVFEKIDNHLSKEKDITEYVCVINDNKLTYTIELVEKIKRLRHGNEISADINERIWSIEGIKGEIKPEGSSGGSKNPIEIHLYGNNTRKLLEESERVKSILEKIPGTINSKVEMELGLPTIDISFNEKKARELGLDPMNTIMKLRNIISGKNIIEVKINDENIDVKLKYNESFKSLNDLRKIKLINNKGVPVSISQIVHLNLGQGPSVITRYDNEKVMVASTANDTTTTVKEIMVEFEKKLAESGGLAEGVTYKVGGQVQELDEIMNDLTKKFFISVMLVYAVLLLQFNSFSQPLAILLSVPFSVISVLFGFFLTRIPINPLAFMGVVALVGIAVNDAIVMIDCINNLRRKEGYGRIESIIEGCKSRFKPIVATSLTTIAGVLPIALYSDFFSDIGLALIFGLVGSTFLTLFVIPIMLNMLERIKIKINIFKNKEKQSSKASRVKNEEELA